MLGPPWWLSGKRVGLPMQRQRFNPWSGKIPHASEQLSSWVTTTEPVLYSPSSETEKPMQWEAHTATKTQDNQKLITLKKKNCQLKSKLNRFKFKWFFSPLWCLPDVRQLNLDINLSQTPGLQLVLFPWDWPQACKWDPSNKTTFTNDFIEETLINIYF